MKNIKDFLKKYLPQFLLSFLKIPYRPYVLARNALRLRRIIALADKYRLYYTDELSQRILSDFEHFPRAAVCKALENVPDVHPHRVHGIVEHVSQMILGIGQIGFSVSAHRYSSIDF